MKLIKDTTFFLQTIKISGLILSSIIVLLLNSQVGADILIPIPYGDHERGLRTALELYTPVEHTIYVGETVTWINQDVVSHTVTSGHGIGIIGIVGSNDAGTPDGYFSSGVLAPEKSWSFTFDKAGTFTYFCEIHPWIQRGILVQTPGVETVKNIFSNPNIVATLVVIGAIVTFYFLVIKKQKLSFKK
jgi:plastocyanin